MGSPSNVGRALTAGVVEREREEGDGGDIGDGEISCMSPVLGKEDGRDGQGSLSRGGVIEGSVDHVLVLGVNSVDDGSEVMSSESSEPAVQAEGESGSESGRVCGESLRRDEGSTEGEAGRDGVGKGSRGGKSGSLGYLRTTPGEAFAPRVERDLLEALHVQVGTERGKVREYVMERRTEEKVRITVKAIGRESVRLDVIVTEEMCNSSKAAHVKKGALEVKDQCAGEVEKVVSEENEVVEEEKEEREFGQGKAPEEASVRIEGASKGPVPITSIGQVLQNLGALGWSPHEYAAVGVKRRAEVAKRAEALLMECKEEARHGCQGHVRGLFDVTSSPRERSEIEGQTMDTSGALYAGIAKKAIAMLGRDNGTGVTVRRWCAEAVVDEWLECIANEEIKAMREQRIVEVLVMVKWKKGDLLCQRGWGRIHRTLGMRRHLRLSYEIGDEGKVAMRKEQPRWKRAGDKSRSRLEADVLFLQAYFRSSRRERRGPRGAVRRSWTKGGLRGFKFFWRRVEPACESGSRLASDEKLRSVNARSMEVVDWLRTYTEILKRRENGMITTAHLCSGAGGDSEGVRRMGGSVVGVDIVDQPSFRRRFGNDAFQVMDATDSLAVSKLCERRKVMALCMGPSCQPFSTLAISSRVKDILALVRKAAVQTGKDYVLENVIGSKAHLRGNVVRLTGRMFGLKVDKGRYFETSFELTVERALVENEASLQGAMCLGGDANRRWPRQDV